MKLAARLAGLFFLFWAQTLWAAVPQKVNVQGVLRDGLGDPISGPVNLTLRIYDLQGGGSLLYTETQSGVSVSDGLFNVALGDSGSIPDSIWSKSQLELGITVNADPEISPRTRLNSSPFARAASRVSGDIETGPGSIAVNGSGGDGGSIAIGEEGVQRVRILADSGRGNIAIGEEGVQLTELSGDSLSGILKLGNFPDYGALELVGSRPVVNAILKVRLESGPIFEVVHLKGDSTGSEMKMTGDPDFDLLRLRAGEDSATIRISGQRIGDPDFDVLRIEGDSAGARLRLSGDPDFDLLRVEADEDSVWFGINAQAVGDPGREVVRIVGGGGGGKLQVRQPAQARRMEIRALAGELAVALRGINQNDVTAADLDVSDDGGRFLLRSGAPAGTARLFLDATGAEGRIGINTVTPAQALDVVGSICASGLIKIAPSGTAALLKMDPGVGQDHTISMENGNNVNWLFGTAGADFRWFKGVSGEMMRITSAGNVGIGTPVPTSKLQVIGNICATGTIGPCSDGRYKEEIETIDNALEIVSRLRGVDFDWKREEYPQMSFAEGKQLGFVAQEVQEVLPMIVSEGSDGYYSVDYGRLAPVLVEAVKEQQRIIENQNGELSAVKSRLEELQKLVFKLLEGKSDSGTRLR